jgi:Thioredoxin-like proteins and domains
MENETNLTQEETIKKIEETLDKVRPFLERDGGNVIFDSFEDGIVYVNFQGACEGCSLISEDLDQGIEVILMEEVPGVNAVRLASDKAYIKEAIKKAKEEHEKELAKEKKDN